MNSIEKLLSQYLDYLEIEKNRSIRTRENYEFYLRTFFHFAHIISVRQITTQSVRDFRIALARKTHHDGRKLKKSTQNYYAIAIRNFLKFLIKRDYSVPSPDEVELPHLKTRQLQILEYKDLERFLEAPKGNNLRALRDRAILEMLFSTGLRLSELCALDRYLNFDRGEFSIRGKGEKVRVVFVSERARGHVQAYLDIRPDAEKALFVSLTREGGVIGRITPRAVQRLVSLYARKAGITDIRVTPHSLRHQFATDLLINGADLRSVQELLGHENVSTTQIYTHLTNKELKEVYRAFHGRRRT